MRSSSTIGHKGNPARTPARLLTSALVTLGLFASYVAMLAPASAQTTSSIAGYIPDTALVSAEFEIDPQSDQVMLSAELLERANLGALLSEDDLDEFEEGLGAVSLFASGDAAVFLTELPIDESVTLDDITSDAANVTTDPESTLGGEIPQGWAVVIMPDDPDSMFNLYSSAIFQGEMASAEEVDYNGYTIMTQAGADEFNPGVSIALVDDVIALASQPEDIETVIDTATGDLDPLSDSAGYTDVRSALETDVLNFGYVNGPALLDALDAQDPEALATIPEDLAASFGAHQGYAFWADDPGFRLDTIALAAEGADIPAATSFEPAFTENLPATSLVYVGGADLGQNPGLNALALLFAQELVAGNSFGESTPVVDAEAQAEAIFAEAEGVLGFNLKTDLLDQLVGEWAMAGSVADITGPAPTGSAVFVTEVDDPEPVSGILTTLTNIVASQSGEGLTLTSRTVNGSDVTVVDLSESGAPLVLEFGVVENQLIIGVNEGIDGFVSGPTDALADDAIFQDTFAELPGEVTSIAYVNVQEILPLVEDVIAQTSTTTLDADPACGDYDTQIDAQAAYDEDDFENFILDLDFDGEACEDYFDPSTPDPSATGVGDINILSVGSVMFADGDAVGSSTIILIGE
ncbi:MAG: DUF3352 domain-containing protein [Chloroflexia bacterium]|nr:DUF3352 domain-containing protein [Chloroflexia bacterium]